MELLPRTQGISLLTHGIGLKDSLKDYLHRLGLGSSRGPLAVEQLLVQGLKNISATFNINPASADLFKNVCILRSASSFEKLQTPGDKYTTVGVGPNLTAVELSSLYAKGLNIDFFLAPSKQVEFSYIYHGLPEEKIRIWPVGIDTEKYKDTSESPKRYDCLLYFKGRKKEELKQVEELLNKFGQTFKLVAYGSYNEREFLKYLTECRYAVILDATESQGIAIESIMSSNLPLFVLDQIYLGHPEFNDMNENLRVTSVPYWSDMCGVKVPTDSFAQSKNFYLPIPETAEKFREFLERLQTFHPRKFILENLTLEKQAHEFISLFEI
jgi:hypothetical protein